MRKSLNLSKTCSSPTTRNCKGSSQWSISLRTPFSMAIQAMLKWGKLRQSLQDRVVVEVVLVAQEEKSIAAYHLASLEQLHVNPERDKLLSLLTMPVLLMKRWRILSLRLANVPRRSPKSLQILSQIPEKTTFRWSRQRSRTQSK